MSPGRVSLVAALSTTAAALGFGNFFTGGGTWAVSPLLCIVVVTLVGVAGRMLSWATGWTIFAQVIAVIALITAMYAGDLAYAGVIPNFDSLERLGKLAAAGMDESRRQVAPIDPSTGTTLLVTFLVAPAAIAVDRLAAAHRAAVAGLPLFVMYAVVTAVLRTPLPILTYLLPVAGFLAMLWLDESVRKSGWGEMSHSGRRPSDQIGLIVGGVAIVLGLLVPALIPTPNGGIFQIGSGSGKSRAPTTTVSKSTDLGGQLNLSNQIKLMTVRTAQTRPPYLRALVLDRWTTQKWVQRPPTANQVLGNGVQLTAPNSTAPTAQVSARITVQNFNDSVVPVYYSPSTVRLGAGFSFDVEQGVVFSRNRTVGGLTYQVNAKVPNPTAEDLRAASQTSALPSTDLQVPAGVPNQIRALVASITAGQRTAYDKTLAINTYFTSSASGFVYSLTVPQGNSGDPLLDFITNKQGFCEQYASAMASMLRLAGVPSRVVIGYTPGKKQPDGSWQVTTDDAHAWVEAYIGDAGWIQFDPTPIGTRGTVPEYAPRGGASASSSSSSGANASSTATANAGPQQNLDDQLTAGSGSGSSGLSTGAIVAVSTGSAGALALISIPALVRINRRRRRLKAAGSGERPGAHLAWDELLSSARDYQRPTQSAQTPRRIVSSWRRDFHLDDTELDAALAVMLAEEEASYAPTYTANNDLPSSVRTVRAAMSRNADRRTRIGALLLPASWWERRSRAIPDDPTDDA